jgi:hypothetical protein
MDVPSSGVYPYGVPFRVPGTRRAGADVGRLPPQNLRVDDGHVDHDAERSPQEGHVDRAEQEALDETMRGLASKLGGTAHGFFVRRTRYTGGNISTQLVLFLSEAALAGVVGNAIYDAIREIVRVVAARIRARTEKDGLDEADVAELACAGARLTLSLDEAVDLVVEEVAQDGADSAWQVRIRNPGEDEDYRVWVSRSEDLASVWLLVNR